MNFKSMQYLPVLLILLLGSCSSEEESALLRQAVVAGKLKVTGLTVTAESNQTIVEAGQSWPLKATANIEGGSTLDVSSDVSWTSDNTAIATMSNTGVLTGAAINGSQTVSIMASLATFNSSYVMRISNAAISSVQIVSDSLTTLDECRSSSSLKAEGTYEDATVRPLLNNQLTWNSTDTNLAVFDAASPGLLLAKDAGTLNITATHINSGLVSPSHIITLNDVLSSLSTSPSSTLTLDKDAANQAIIVTGDFSGAKETITANSSFTNTVPAVATSVAGVIDPLIAGSTTITASCGGQSANLTVTVREFVGIELVDPRGSSPTALVINEVLDLAAYARYDSTGTGVTAAVTDTTTEIDSDITWTVSAGSEIATVTDAGVVTMGTDFSTFTPDQITVTGTHKTQATFTDSIILSIQK